MNINAPNSRIKENEFDNLPSKPIAVNDQVELDRELFVEPIVSEPVSVLKSTKYFQTVVTNNDNA
jgi:hypothetical protein